MGDYLSVLMDLSLIESWKRRASEILNEKDFQLKRIPKKKTAVFKYNKCCIHGGRLGRGTLSCRLSSK